MKLTSEETKELRARLANVWTKRNGQIEESMVEHCIKSAKYIVIDDMYISVCQAKPVIKSTMWYDDTKADPGKSYQRFFDYNNMNMPQYIEQLNRHGDRAFLVPKYNSLNMQLCNISYIDSDSNLFHVLTADEIVLINDAIREVREDYLKRLETYYKKYNNKIISMGYWVDR